MPTDWTKNRIKSELALRGLSLAAVSTAAGLHRTAASIAIKKPWPKAEQAIATAIGKDPREIWPSRYPSARGGIPE